MKHKLLVVVLVVGSALGLAGAVFYTQLVKPVGFVSSEFCTNPQKPCSSYTLLAGAFPWVR
jgi:hypothetical protein